MGFSPLFVETAEFLGALNEITLGNGLVNDIADSVNFALTEVPSLTELGGSLTGLARPDTDQPQQLSQAERDHAQLAEAFFLSPIGFSLDEMRGLPRLASALMDGERASRSINTTNERINKAFSSLRGFNGFDQAEMERLAESIAEGVANSAYGFRNKNALLAALASVYGQDIKSEETASSTVSQWIDPLGLFSSQEIPEKKEEEVQEQEEKEEVENQAEKEVEQEAEKEIDQQAVEEQEQQVERQAEETETPDQIPTEEEAAFEEKVIEEEFGDNEEETDEQDEEEDGKAPQRFFFWSRTNPFGIFQPATDMWYLTNWAFLNPLAMLEWKAFAFNQCMSILNNKELCLKSLKVEPNAVNHGGTNSAWKPSTAP